MATLGEREGNGSKTRRKGGVAKKVMATLREKGRG
jgi:hypothetical protein